MGLKVRWNTETSIVMHKRSYQKSNDSRHPVSYFPWRHEFQTNSLPRRVSGPVYVCFQFQRALLQELAHIVLILWLLGDDTGGSGMLSTLWNHLTVQISRGWKNTNLFSHSVNSEYNLLWWIWWQLQQLVVMSINFSTWISQRSEPALRTVGGSHKRPTNQFCQRFIER